MSPEVQRLMQRARQRALADHAAGAPPPLPFMERSPALRRQVYLCYAPHHFAWGDDAAWQGWLGALQEEAWSPTPTDCPAMRWEQLEAWYRATAWQWG